MRSEDAVKLEEFMRLPVQEQLEKARKDPIELLLFIAYLVGYSGIRDDWRGGNVSKMWKQKH